MKWALVAILVVHGLLHFLGVAKAFRLATLPQLTQPISRPLGLAWLAAGLAVIATAVLLAAGRDLWWVAGLAAAILSQLVIVTSWSDAKAGTIANLLLLVAALSGWASRGPGSLQSELRHAAGALGGRAAPLSLLGEADVAPLPPPVRRYLEVTGSLGRPRVDRFAATWRGRIRASAHASWMPFTAEQWNLVEPPRRFFFLRARRAGLPVDVLHVFRNGTATMRVRLASLLPLVTAGGEDLGRAETVTFFNDLCLLAPGALVDPAISWEPVDAISARARFTAGTQTIGALLVFDRNGELVDFVSEDRLAASPDGKRLTRRRWSTPVGTYRRFGGRRAATRGEGRWGPPGEEYAYIELELLDLRTNPAAPSSREA